MKSKILIFRHLLIFTLSILSTVTTMSANAEQMTLSRKIHQLEKDLDMRIGISFYDENNNKTWQYNGDQSFPLVSTFKAFACAALLARVDSNQDTLERAIPVHKNQLITYSPITEKYIDKTMTNAELCSAAITLSDNTAGNLILKNIGGPSGLTQFMRSIGDEKTQLSRWEPELNEANPGDTRDTTSPNAIVKSLRKVLLGSYLSISSQKQLTDWLLHDKVADGLIRSILPNDWKIGDKTGAGGYGSRAIIAVIWPPERKPVFISIYLTQTKASMDIRNHTIVEISKVIKESLIKY